MDCYLCQEKENIQVPLLVCGHYCCTVCYCKIKSSRYNECFVCNERLKRSNKKNKLNHHY